MGNNWGQSKIKSFIYIHFNPDYPRFNFTLTPIILIILILLFFAGCSRPGAPLPDVALSGAYSEKLTAALHSAGDNRPELEAVLAHYSRLNDPVRYKAARFLIANMPGHGAITAGWADKDGHDLKFNALDYPDYATARNALDLLAEKHGPLRRKKLGGVKDIETVDRELLISNIDLAVESRQTKPWAKDLPFDAFCDYLLPYRTSFEPLSDWRRPLMVRYLDAADGISGPDQVKRITAAIQKDVRRLVAFDSRYYLYPTSQGFDRMLRSRQGRCDDITTMMTYALRAAGFACAYDFTPAWADRDNNHAWLVVLDRHGQGRADLANRAAKVFRRTFSIRDRNMGDLQNSQPIPAWMSDRHFIDVTCQYMPVSDVRVKLAARPEQPASRAYLCVFNAGKWVPVHQSRIRDGQAVFTDMGRNIVYLPGFYRDQKIRPAAPPFILHADGHIQTLTGAGPVRTTPVTIKVTSPKVRDTDTRTVRPSIPVRPGRTYTLSEWDNGWKPIGTSKATAHGLTLEKPAENRLYWLTEKDGRKLERIFILEGTRQVVY